MSLGFYKGADLEGLPPVWLAAAFPFTFVITEVRGVYVASARDAGPPGMRFDLGAEFKTLEAAQDACRRFLQRQWQ